MCTLYIKRRSLEEDLFISLSDQSNCIYLNCISSEHLFNLKFATKDLERNAKKSEKQEREEKTKLKKVQIHHIVVLA